jgi:hypothetical protein
MNKIKKFWFDSLHSLYRSQSPIDSKECSTQCEAFLGELDTCEFVHSSREVELFKV